jgi:mRNA-degrading endonuclease RelE of RelBE toxin-antitoxin system
MFTVIETPTFVRTAAAIWSLDEVHDFIDYISANSEAGDLIKGTQSLRKVRWSRTGMGKRGGARVIYYVRNQAGEILLIAAYAKGDVDNLPAAFINRLKELYDA